MLTFIPLEEIRPMESWEGAELNKAKEILAYHLTELVHGKEEADKADAAAKAIFMQGSTENMPESEITAEDFTEGRINLQTLLVKAGLATSKTDGRRAIEQGGVTVNGEKVTDVYADYAAEDFSEEFVIKKGKKNFRKIIMK